YDPGKGGGPFVSLGVPKASVEDEPAVAADGKGLVVVAFQGAIHYDPKVPVAEIAVAYVVSHDGGASFGPPREVEHAPGRNQQDVVLATAPDGVIWIAWIDYVGDDDL